MVNPLKKWVDSPKKEQKRLSKMADKVEAYADEYAGLSNIELQNKTPEFKDRLTKGETLDDLLPEAFAVVREGAKRVLGMFPFHVQIMGGIVLHEGNIAEMKTGEGKTLTATMPVYLNALAGKGVHVITVNEYLSQRDATEMGELYNWLGLTVAVNNSKMSPDEKRWAYQQDIVYSTNSEIGFDYLRDNMAVDADELVQRPLDFTLIDEVDSVLIDEARTPLIISGGAMDSNKLYVTVDRCVKNLVAETDYKVDLESKTVSLTDEGIRKVESYFDTDNLYAPQNVAITHHLDNALRANYIMLLDKDYVVRDGEVLIVDSFTGRVMDGRRFSDGLHQAIEAKEGVDIQEETRTLANITYQNLFRMYKKLAGMTGTAKTEEEEFREIYNMLVIPIPTNRPIARDDRADVLYPTLDAKFRALLNEIKELHAKGQPMLIGTVAVETSEYLSGMLDEAGIEHAVLNAKNHAKEADIIMNAGQRGAVTIATNMAGRGTDIKLGPGVVELGGLAVLGTERHESRRIDNQLRGRAGRQGDPGMSQFYLSLEDDLMKRFGGDRISNFLEKIQGEDASVGDTVIRSRLLTKQVESAQKRVEGNNYDSRKNVLQYDDVLREQREIMYSQRHQVLTEQKSLKYVIMQMIERSIGATVNLYMQGTDPEAWELTKLLDFCISNLYSPDQISLSDLQGKTADEVKGFLMDKVNAIYKEKEDSLYSPDQMLLFDRAVILKVVDDHWTEHIDSMDQLRQSIQLRGYAQLNPLVEYQREGYDMFEEMIGNMDFDVTRLFMKSEARQAMAVA